MCTVNSRFNICLLWLVLSACAQGQYGVKKSYAYWQAVYPGMNRVTPPGEAKRSLMDTVLLVYLETTKGLTPVWNAARIGGSTYIATVIPISADSIFVGKTKPNRQPVVIKAGKGNSLWRVELNRQPAQKMPMEVNYNKDKIILMDTIKQDAKNLSIDSVTEIMPQLRP